MRKLIEFQILDRNAVHYGYDFFELMSNAGAKLAEHILNNIQKSDSVVFVCGYGNNAGDGYVAAKLLCSDGFDAKICAVSEPRSGAAVKAANDFEGKIHDISELENLASENSLLIDCLLGSGINGEPREPFAGIIKRLKQFPRILSVDIPSGFGTNNAVRPNQTLTFHDQKTGMTIENCGEIFVADVGFTKELDELTGPGELLLFPDFDRNKRKGQNGKVAIVGGGSYSGAPALAALGAYRSGVDLVHVFVPESSYVQVSSFAPELIIHKLNGEVVSPEVIELLKEGGFDSIVLGPGMGKNPKSLETAQKVIECFDNIVIDADAIFDYSFGDKKVILTPHRGELTRLGIEGKRRDLMNFARSNNLTVLLKGDKDLITDGYSFKINNTGHPRMSVGGTGDLLSGICGGLLAKGLSPFEACRLASYSFGKAGELCFNEFGAGFLPTDLALCISKSLRKN